MKIKEGIKKSAYLQHETKKNVLVRFFLVLSIVLLYFLFVSYHYGIKQGFLVTILTWSFFVFCTPVADAGFLLDFPIRLITKIRMTYSEIAVWVIAFVINLVTMMFNPGVYDTTELLKLFKQIILHPNPLWMIILLSALGTFLSVYFGDELIDVVKHKHRKKHQKHRSKYLFVIFLFILLCIVFLYYYLLKKMGIAIFF